MTKITKSTLLNIDSTFRNIYPKHIYTSNNNILPNNPLTFTANSNIIKINYPNHNLNQGDNIIIQNIEGISKILSNCIYLINNFKYALIYFENNLININYKNFINDIYINIELYGSQNENNLINNISFNYLLGIKKILIANDLAQENLSLLNDISIKIFGSRNINLLNQHCLFFELPFIYINNINNYYNINQILKITYLHINGIKLGYLNANYPINNDNYQNCHTINKINNENEFEILLNYYSYNTSISGEKNIQIFKITNSLPGYPNINSYTIYLKKSFNNVSKIELISSEFPYVDILIKQNINDKLYWKNIEDGNYIYSVTIDNGFYNSVSLLNKIKTNINLVERINSSPINKIYNNFDIILDTSTHIISFYPFNLTKLPNSLSIRTITLNNAIYYILSVSHPNNIVDIGDIITISNSSNITINNNNQIESIDAKYININHNVYSININNYTYDIILGKQDQIQLTIVNTESAGGENVVLKTKTKVSFLFNKNDTFGDIIGFKNIGDIYSITDFNSIITNQDNYIYSNNVNSVGNPINYNNGFMNLDGGYNYMLMYLNDIEYIYTNTNLDNAFAKILLTGNPGDILFNTFINQPLDLYSKNFPISNLTYIDIKFLYPDGNPVNFRNINHSFTLKITEDINI